MEKRKVIAQPTLNKDLLVYFSSTGSDASTNGWDGTWDETGNGSNGNEPGNDESKNDDEPTNASYDDTTWSNGKSTNGNDGK